MSTDVLIIGGWLAGVLCAYKLAQAGVDYALVEADRIGGGITKDTTAKIASQHGLVYDKLIHKFGIETARLYLQANQDALAQFRKLCGEIDCSFEEKDAFVYSRNDQSKIERELTALKYNAAGHSWDCPCHGSRFSEDGALIDNPATDDKKRM